MVSGTGPHAFGGAVDNDAQVKILGAFSGAAGANGLWVASSLTPAANNAAFGVLVSSVTLVEAESGTHARFASMELREPTITTDDEATLTDAMTLSITGAPSAGENNYYVKFGSAFVVNSSGDVGINDTTPTYKLDVNGTLRATGAATFNSSVSKASGSFRIDHPLPAKTETHHLVHSFIEGPRADLLYRGSAILVAGSATVDLDTAAGMTTGTWVLLCRDPQVFTSNESGWDAVRGSVSGSTLTIECQDVASTDTVSWMVVAERKDQHMYDTGWTDDEGRPIVEPEKPEEPEP